MKIESLCSKRHMRVTSIQHMVHRTCINHDVLSLSQNACNGSGSLMTLRWRSRGGSSGLRAPFDGEKVLKLAQLAMSDPEHHLYPLFPNSDRTSLPTEVLQGEAEPEVGQAGDTDGEGDAPGSEDSVHDSPADEETAQRARAARSQGI
jgi:hypothetical protein